MSAPRRNPGAMVAILAGIAVAIAVPLLVATRSNAPEPTPPPPLVPSQITRVEHASGTAERTSPGAWTITIAGDDTQWPASTAAIRAALRAAADIVALETAGPADSEPTNAFTLTDRAGAPRTLAIADAAIGGKRTVVIDSAAAVRAPDALAERLAPGPAAWREASVFPAAGPDVTRILLQQPATDTDPARELDLTKAAGRWLIVSPVLARADEGALRNAIARLAGASIIRFLDGEPSALESGLDDPAFVVTVESGNRSRRVSFAASPDAAGQHRYAATGAGHFFIADVSLLSELRLDPAAYTDRRPSAVAPADVHAITVDAARATRTLKGWTDAPFSPAAILTTLTTAEGNLVAFERPAGWTELATITLEDLASQPLDVIPVGADSDGTLHAETLMPGGAPVYYSLPSAFRQSLSLTRE